MKVYTKTGDAGQTSLFGGRRVSKTHIRIEAYGTIDELNSTIGLLASVINFTDQNELLVEIQRRLFTIGAILASDPEKELPTPDLHTEDIVLLENTMDNLEAQLPPLRSFVLPGGSSSNAIAHICRTITRRAERRVLELAAEEDIPMIVVRYLNRLSDYFFMLSRYVALMENHPEIPWVPRERK